MIMKEKLEILVVEDMEENIEAAKEFFDQLGKFSVDYATNLEEAKELLKKKDYILGIFDLDLPLIPGGKVVEKAGLELGRIAARKKENMFYVYYSGGFYHGGPRTYVFLSEESVLRSKPDFDTYSKESSRGWEELYEKLVEIGKKAETPGSREELKRSLERYIKEVGKLPKIHPRSIIPYIMDVLELNEEA
jgi:hypothetical protein